MTSHPLLDIDPCLAKGRFLGWDRYARTNWVCQPKKDGWREVSQIVDGRCYMTGRKRDLSGELIERGQNMYHTKGAPSILNGAIFDGEVWLPGGVGSDVGSFMSCKNPNDAWRKYVDLPDTLQPRYMIFDVIAMPGRKYVTKLAYRERLNLLKQLKIGDAFSKWSTFVDVVPELLSPEADYAAYLAAGGEGVVLKDLRSTYVYGPCGSWVKVVPKEAATLTCVGFQRGEGKYAHTLGALAYNGTVEGVFVSGHCSGMSDSMRHEIFDDPEAYLGKPFDVTYKRITSGSLISANFVRWRTDL